jgi:crotonobetainyl-CoA:carnitine CoA-transferase CaiB-like acyl-CoA transferase
MDGVRLGVRLSPPTLGQHTTELLAALGCEPAEVAGLQASRAVFSQVPS